LHRSGIAIVRIYRPVEAKEERRNVMVEAYEASEMQKKMERSHAHFAGANQFSATVAA